MKRILKKVLAIVLTLAMILPSAVCACARKVIRLF